MNYQELQKQVRANMAAMMLAGAVERVRLLGENLRLVSLMKQMDAELSQFRTPIGNYRPR